VGCFLRENWGGEGGSGGGPAKERGIYGVRGRDCMAAWDRG